VVQRGAKSEAFEALAMPLFDALYNLAHWLTQDRNEAEDLVQETYLKALKGFASFQQGTNFQAWIYRILRNTFLTSRSGLSSKMTEPLDLETDPATPETPESLLLFEADQDLLQEALERLGLATKFGPPMATRIGPLIKTQPGSFVLAGFDRPEGAAGWIGEPKWNYSRRSGASTSKASERF
jgi:RNA polymerase sigma factor (sigma-70 family)